MDCEESSHSVNIICSETVRYSFVSHLTGALCRQGISVSVFADTDGRELEDDQNQGPRVSVVIFSETYTSSIPWFVKLLEHHKKNGYTIVPVFYGVDPSVVNRNLECLKTLPRAENLTGHQSSDSELVEEIVRDVYGKLSPTERIGIYSRLLEIENLLCDQPWGIRSLGIWGMPGIGKTTLAKAVFEQMSNDYDASCFIEDFDEALYKAGPHRLLEENIFKIVIEKFGISSCYITRLSLLRDKLCDTRILLVLDDVRNPLVAESFLGKLNWFGPGSLIIITSRYKQVFALCHVNQIYKVEGLNEHDALQLFSRTAFEEDLPEQNDTELSMKVIDYANGNPLALRIYGQKLKGKKSEMETTFLKLKQCPPQKIQDRLQSVYSALGDNEKYIFLDIACFFKGENVDYVVQMLNGCGYFPRIGIDVLVEKCLVTISENTLQINDLVQYIIREIIVGERIQMKKCTTLWQPSSIRYLLEDDELKADDEPKATPKRAMVAEDIEGISLDTSNLIFDVNPDAFKNMLSLRFLKIYNSNSENVLGLNFPKGLNSLPCKLRLLLWENYPFESLPQGFDLRELVELNMPCSQLKKLRTRTKNLGMLKRIKLCHSQQLIEFDLILDAKYIEIIDLQGCTRLQSFPDTSELQHLRVVNLTGCTEIKSFQGAPPNIEELHLQGTSISEIPISIVTQYPQNVKLDRQKLLNLIENFHDVEHIDLESVTDLVKVSSSSQGFGKLVHLNMKNCSHLQSLPDMASLESLQVLLLSGCSELEKIKGFPRNMKKLYLGGTAVREVPQLPQSLEFLNAHGCKNLKSVRMEFEQLPRHYIFSNCLNFSPQVIPEFLEKDLTRVASLAGAKQQELINASEVSICTPFGAHLRSYFFLQAGPYITIDLAPWTQKPISGVAMTVVVSFQDDYHNTVGLGIRCICTWKARIGYSKRTERLFQCWAPTEAPKVERDHIFIFYDTQMHPSGEGNPNCWDDEVKFKFHTVSWENKLLGANCMVALCDVEIITAPTDDTIQGEITIESEATSVIEEQPQGEITIESEAKTVTEEHPQGEITIESEAKSVTEENPPTSSRIMREEKSLNHVSSSEQRKVNSAKSKLTSMGTMLWKRMRTIRRDKEKNTLTNREQVDSKPASTSPPPLSNSLESHFGWGHWFTLKDLKIATNRFSKENVIEESSYQVVYRGWLINGTPVAVKKILIMSDEGEKELISEVNAIGYVRHKNIVRLLGYCIEGTHRILVYEYVSNGNLEKWLHGAIRQHGCLTWEARMKVLIGTSKALAYLHEAIEPKVVHRDIKPSNILINDDLEAKVSNFGLAKLLCAGESHEETRVIGSIGYIAPEYLGTGRANEKTDVYNFGIVFLEAITGRKPFDYSRPADEANLVEWLKMMVETRRSEEVVDPDIGFRPPAKSLNRALMTALLCVDPDPYKRPKMSQIAPMLEPKYLFPGEVTSITKEH